MKKMLSILLVILLAIPMLLPAALAELPPAPMADEYWRDAELEDFMGIWSLLMVRSDKPVNMSQYRSLEIDEDGHAFVGAGSNTEDVFFDLPAQVQQGGYLYLADPEGENGRYYVLYDSNLMGCMETLDNPGTIQYLQRYDAQGWDEEEQAYAEEAAAVIWSYAGAIDPAPVAEDFQGVWKVWSYSYGNRQIRLDPAIATMTLTVEDGQARILSSVTGEEEPFASDLQLADGYAVIDNPDDDGSLYLFRCGDNELLLVNDLELPTYGMYLFTEAYWNDFVASGALDLGLELGQRLEIASLAEVAGSWESTHLYMLNRIQPMEMLDEDTILISLDGEGRFADNTNGSPFEGTARLEDGVVIVETDDDTFYCFMLYENDVLVQTASPEDTDVALIYQRADHN